MARAPARVFTAEDDLPEPKADKNGWLPIDSAPQDGKVIMVRGDGAPPNGDRPEEMAVWRNSRRFDAKTTKWEDTSFWALANAGGARLPFEPIMWRARAGVL
jgi:hypothetical protein